MELNKSFNVFVLWLRIPKRDVDLNGASRTTLYFEVLAGKYSSRERTIDFDAFTPLNQDLIVFEQVVSLSVKADGRVRQQDVFCNGGERDFVIVCWTPFSCDVVRGSPKRTVWL